MEINIPIGTKLEQKETVTKDKTAAVYGSGLLEVYATPAMIAFMEQTAYKSINHLLPEGFGTVGISISAQHKKATLPGKEVRCVSEVTKVENKRVFFTLTAYDDAGEIGSCEHVRYIVDNEKFISRLME